MREETAEKLTHLQKQANQLIKNLEARLKSMVSARGFQWCTDCDGTGAIERLDSGYMKRFGLPEWDGCSACGGTTNERGYGYVRRE